MTEKKFLSFILTESCILIILGLCILILPKITDITFGFTLCLISILYGGYKAIISFLARNFERHFILNIISGIILFSAGVILFFAPVVDMMVVVSLTGTFFILRSVDSASFAEQTKNILNSPKLSYLTAFMQLFFGIILLVILPALWLAGILLGIDFVISGVLKMNLYISKSYN